MQSANPCTTVDVPSIGRRRTVRYPLVRAPRTTPTNARMPHVGGHAGDILAGCSCPRRESGVFQSPGARKGARPATKAGRGATWSSLPWERRRSVPGRELSGPGADDPTSRGLPQGPGRGHTEVPGALWALDAATSVVLPLRPVSGCGSRWV